MSAITVLGLGAMGSGMAHALVDGGFDVTVFNRDPAKTVALAERGALVTPDAQAAVSGAQTVLVSLSDEAAVNELVLDRVLPVLLPGSVLIDASTVSPAFARQAAATLAAVGVQRVEACAVGNPPMARAGQLRWLTAGDAAAADSVRSVFEACGQDHRHIGPAGSASVLKLALNLLLGVQTAGLAEAVALVESAGVDRSAVLDTVERSGWRSPVLSFRAGFMRDRSYLPAGFRTTLMHKDLDLALGEASAAGTELPVTRRSAEAYAELIAAGRGDADAAVLAEAHTAGR